MSAVVIVFACIAGMALCMLVMSVVMKRRHHANRAPDAERIRHGEIDQQ